MSGANPAPAPLHVVRNTNDAWIIADANYDELSMDQLEVVIADVAALAAIRDYSDNNPVIGGARRWYSRLNKSELLDSTTATRVGVLLCGLDATNNRYVTLKTQNDALAKALDECATRFERCCIHSGSDKEFAAHVVEDYRALVKTAKGEA